ncbi:unnamed protein product, partial [Cyprideis torosa]
GPWIGGIEIGNTNIFVWSSSQKPIVFDSNWASLKPDSPSRGDGIALRVSETFQWVDCPNQRTLPFICETEANTPPQAPRCPEGFFRLSTGCYAVFTTYTPWKEAQSHCASLTDGGRLVEFDDPGEYYLLVAFLKQNNVACTAVSWLTLWFLTCEVSCYYVDGSLDLPWEFSRGRTRNRNYPKTYLDSHKGWRGKNLPLGPSNDFLEYLGDDLDVNDEDPLELDDEAEYLQQQMLNPHRYDVQKGRRGATEETGRSPIVDYDEAAGRAMIRDTEYLQHSASLWGSKYMQGGAGEGNQDLKPDGSIPNSQEIKSDSVLPAYCEPPNPCPVGYTEEDGCLEDFDNTAAFSREYQMAQECMCDSEHMFNCPDSTQDDQISTLARTISNQGLNHKDLDNLLQSMDNYNKKVVAKKFYDRSQFTERESQMKNKARALSKRFSFRAPNPFLQGSQLPIAAKKFSVGKNIKKRG